MRKPFLFLPLLFLLSSCFLINNPCKNVDCKNGGSCDDGNCNCPDTYYGTDCSSRCVNGTYNGSWCECATGYEGAACDVVTRAKFLGTYAVAENCTSAVNYSITIAEHASGLDKIAISNLRQTSNVVIGTVSSNTIQIPLQAFGTQQVEGYGEIDGTTLSMNYSINLVPSGVIYCSLTGIR